MRPSVTVSILAVAVLLSAGCGGGQSAHETSPTIEAGIGEPAPPPTCTVSAAKTGRDFGTDSGAVQFSRPPVFAWGGAGISPVALTIEPGPSQVRITGRLLDGAAKAAFIGFGAAESSVSELVLPGPFTDGEHLSGYITLPEPGCWLIEVDVDGEQQSVTLYVYGKSPPADCPVSRTREVRPDIAPGLGAGPVWMIATAAGEWEGPDFLAKTIWIVDDAVQGEVRIRGRRLDNDDVARFQGYHEYDNDGVSAGGREVILGPPHGRSKDRRGYVIYPSAGCWRFTAESDGQMIAQITAYLYDVVP